MSDYEFCNVERDGRLLLVTLNRPEVYNALHPPAQNELDRIWNDFAADDELWVGIVTGAGAKAFCAGNDLKFQAAGNEVKMPPSGFGGLTNRFDLTKPLIAAVNGFAMGGGFEIALACDLIIAGENAIFAFPEPRVGLMAAAGGVHRLPRMIGQKQALGMLLTGRRVPAREGHTMGFVNEVVVQSDVLEAAKRWAGQILECAPISVRASKEAVYRGMDEASLQTAINMYYPEHHRMHESEDYIEGPKAFAEKRAPRWKNR